MHIELQAIKYYKQTSLTNGIKSCFNLKVFINYKTFVLSHGH